MFFYIEVRARAMTHDCDDSLIEEVFALMKLRFIIFLHIANRAVYIESTSLYMSDKRRRERKPREKRKESMHSINDSDERAHTLRRYLNDRSANERNVDIQCYVSNNDRQAMYHHYQRHLHYNCYNDIFVVFIEPMLYLPLPLKIILSHENTSVC